MNIKKLLTTLILFISVFFIKAQVSNLGNWMIRGNAIATNTNFIGTTTNRSLNFYSNGIFRGKIDSSGILDFKKTPAIFGEWANGFQLQLRNGTNYLKFNIDTTVSNPNTQIFPTNGALSLFGSNVVNIVLAANDNISLGASNYTPSARVDIVAGNATWPAIRLRSQTAVTTPTLGNLWYETARGFLFFGNNTTIGAISTNSVTTLGSTVVTVGQPTLNVIGTFSTSSTSTLTGLQNNGTLNVTAGSTLTGVRNNGTVSCTGNFSTTARVQFNQGAGVASVAGAMTLGGDGNTFEITGTNAITSIVNTSWQNGSEVTLFFTSTASLTDGTANAGANIGFELAGNVNFSATADDALTLVLCTVGGVQRWREKCRSVN